MQEYWKGHASLDPWIWGESQKREQSEETENTNRDKSNVRINSEYQVSFTTVFWLTLKTAETEKGYLGGFWAVHFKDGEVNFRFKTPAVSGTHLLNCWVC